MSNTYTSTVDYSSEEIAELKRKDAERYERERQRGTAPDRIEYYPPTMPNRKERRKQIALSKSKGGIE